MRTLSAACLAFAATIGTAAFVSAADDEAPQGDMKKLQGQWTGMVGPNEDFPLTLTIKGKNVIIAFKTPNGEDRQLKGEIKIDEKAKPKTLDWVHFTRPDGQEAPENLAIYELEGDGTLKLCSGGPNNPRPTEFKTVEGTPQHVIVLKRKKD